MNPLIPINLAVEDELSEWVARRALAQHRRYAIGTVFRRGGFGYLKKQAHAFNNAAKGCPFLLLTDLDQHACPPELIGAWLTRPQHDHFLLRVAVREIEGWLLGDASGLGAFLGLRKSLAIPDPEALTDPKQELLRAALRCPRRLTRDALVWRDEESGRLLQGPDYNGTLARFVSGSWDINVARRKCRSLDKLLAALARLEKSYGCAG